MECVIFLCGRSELTRERKGYFDAFSKRLTVFCLSPEQGQDINSILSKISNEYLPVLILHPEASPYLPLGMEGCEIPTACFQIDTYVESSKRAKWAQIFQIAFVFHPGYESIFASLGHSCPVLLPHAVEQSLINISDDSTRIFDIGWVGRLTGREYRYRREILNQLKSKYKMNDIERNYSTLEMTEIYSRSKIVVNVSRDNYLKDANLRCFEAMASGALLFTPYQSELSDLGFEENQHYVSFMNLEDLEKKVQYYLTNSTERIRIANLGQQKVILEHTYDNRVSFILDFIKRRSFLPLSKVYSHKHINQLYFYYFSQKYLLDDSFLVIQQIRKESLLKSLLYSILLLKSFIGKAFYSIR